MTDRDADFSSKTTKVIASRAGYRCSFPDCDQSTVGPGSGPDDIETKGTAAHIYSSATGDRAPRGTGGLTSDQRKMAANGIWLCRDHGHIVDVDRGKNYPASTLQAWKALQEDRIAQELRKVSVGSNGWLERITVERSPLFEQGTTITLGKVTLLFGENGLGKTALCEWLTGASDATAFERWAGEGHFLRDISLRVTVRKPDFKEIKVDFSGHSLSVSYEGLRASNVNHAINVIYIRDRLDSINPLDDLEFLASTWGVHPYHVPTILQELCSSKFGYIKAALIEKDDDLQNDEAPAEISPGVSNQRAGREPIRLSFKVGEHKNYVQFGSLSSRERSQVIVSGAMVIADKSSIHQGTLLILELGGRLLPDELLSVYASKLQGPEFRYQTLLVSPSSRANVNWTGWSMAKLEGNVPRVVVKQ